MVDQSKECSVCNGSGFVQTTSFMGGMSKKPCPNGCSAYEVNWSDLRMQLDSLPVQAEILKYESPLDQLTFNYFSKHPEVVVNCQILEILSVHANKSPHGYALLRRELDITTQSNCSEALDDRKTLTNIVNQCKQPSPSGVSALLELSHKRHAIPSIFIAPVYVDIDLDRRIALSNIELPNFQRFRLRKSTQSAKGNVVKDVSATDEKKLRALIIHTMCIRSAYLMAKSDEGDWIDTICVNANQKWKDPATGVQKEGIIASLQASKADILQLQVSDLDPTACFKHLKGLSTPSVDNISPIRPIFVLNTDDSRVVENKDVAADMEDETNLAAMPWEDFEHLVRQLFEWEFGKNGVEVKVTRASRDRGVDAIMYDPDPLRGGKFVLQAKRYTRTVDVAAVRDLYGTVMNEGANRGILVSTASFGPDAYEFAKDKPISLVDGPNLIALLKRHGKNYKINLEEARRMANETLSNP
jgi:restriction system protein